MILRVLSPLLQRLSAEMPHAQNPHSELDYANVRLRLVGTRVVEDEEDDHHRDSACKDTVGLVRSRPLRDTPEFCKVSRHMVLLRVRCANSQIERSSDDI